MMKQNIRWQNDTKWPNMEIVSKNSLTSYSGWSPRWVGGLGGQNDQRSSNALEAYSMECFRMFIIFGLTWLDCMQ